MNSPFYALTKLMVGLSDGTDSYHIHDTPPTLAYPGVYSIYCLEEGGGGIIIYHKTKKAPPHPSNTVLLKHFVATLFRWFTHTRHLDIFAEA